jgi:pimeloyl-ACP methyl ester carboxylesterase
VDINESNPGNATLYFFEWFEGQSGDTSKPVGMPLLPGIKTFTTPILTITTSYWVRVNLNHQLECAVNSTTATVTVTPAPALTPLIFIPGITGSELIDPQGNEVWPGVPCFYGSLSLNPNETRTDLTATDVIRRRILPPRNVYGSLLETLVSQGYSEGGQNPTLFVFPYDWRRANEDQITGLAGLVALIRHKYPNSKVDILAHSMGGLIARRYILEHPDDNDVRRLITIATPWLGAPKAINVLETGQFIEPFDGGGFNLCTGTIKSLAVFFPGLHELIPSQRYFDVSGGTAFKEDGWDIDGDGNDSEEYNYSNLVVMLDSRYSSAPGMTSFLFHNRTGQDDWHTENSDIEYFHFYGQQRGASTIGQVIARKARGCHRTPSGFDLVCSLFPTKYIDVSPTLGDGTVPLFSAVRNNSLNAPSSHLIPVVASTTSENGRVSHLGIVQNPTVLTELRQILNGTFATSQLALTQASVAVPETAEPSYYIRLIGISAVTVTDASGHVITPFGNAADDNVPSVTTHLLGDKAVLIIASTDETHTISFRSGSDPIELEITKGTDVATAEAVRYEDLMLPEGTNASFSVTSQGAEVLHYDADNNGTFESTISPTASVSGPAAQDTDPPVVTIAATRQANNATISIAASDVGSGVKATYYSTDGAHFQTYTAQFSVDLSQASTIYAFADDSVANRSKVTTFVLPLPITVQLNSSNYSASEAEGIANVSVTRSGDTSSAASVAYATSNGTAKEGKDYIAAQGVLNFSPAETSKSFPVLIIDNAFIDGSRTVNIALSNPSGATLGTQSIAVLTIADNDASTGANPIDQPRSFVEYHYFDFLGRYPDQSGWDFWTNNITGCTPQPSCTEVQRINTSAAYFLSIEFQQTGYLVYKIYKASFGNITDIPNAPVPIKFNEFLPDTQEIRNGVIVNQGNWQQQLETNKQAFTLEFVQRARYITAFPTTMTPAQFVDKLFSNAGVTPSAADRNAAIVEFGSAITTTDVAARSRALRDVAENATLNAQEFNKAFVLMQYFGYLRRNPYDPPEGTLDYSGFNFWLGKLNQFNGNYINAEMVKAFITSSEYRQRFGP